MHNSENLVPAQQLVATNRAHYPNESAEYRAARNALLVEEIELRRQIERVAGQRRALPSGGEPAKDFEFISESGPTSLSRPRRKGYADALQHDVRSTTQGALPQLHLIPQCVEWDRRQLA
jgi:hypothetical protein